MQFALIIAALRLVEVALIGSALSVATSFAMRLRWNWWRLFGDVLIAVLTTVVLLIANGFYYSLRHTWNSDHDQIFMFIGAAAPVVGRLLMFVMRRFGGAAQYP